MRKNKNNKFQFIESPMSHWWWSSSIIKKYKFKFFYYYSSIIKKLSLFLFS